MHHSSVSSAAIAPTLPTPATPLQGPTRRAYVLAAANGTLEPHQRSSLQVQRHLHVAALRYIWNAGVRHTAVQSTKAHHTGAAIEVSRAIHSQLPAHPDRRMFHVKRMAWVRWSAPAEQSHRHRQARLGSSMGGPSMPTFHVKHRKPALTHRLIYLRR